MYLYTQVQFEAIKDCLELLLGFGTTEHFVCSGTKKK